MFCQLLGRNNFCTIDFWTKQTWLSANGINWRFWFVWISVHSRRGRLTVSLFILFILLFIRTQVHKCVICFFVYSDNILYSGMSQTHAPFLSHLVTKPTKWHVRSAKTQVSLGTRPGWSEPSLSAWRKLGSLASHWAHSKNFDHTGRIPRLILVFAGRTAILLVLSWGGSIYFLITWG